MTNNNTDNKTMKFRITALTPTESGTYNESGDILPDMLNGSDSPNSMDEMLCWLSDEGYEPTDGFQGWGEVIKHSETGNILSVYQS